MVNAGISGSGAIDYPSLPLPSTPEDIGGSITNIYLLLFAIVVMIFVLGVWIWDIKNRHTMDTYKSKEQIEKENFEQYKKYKEIYENR